MELACKDETSGNILCFMHFSSKVVFQTPWQMGKKKHEDSLLEKDPDC